jgi:reactive intermediate/imine deaminase
MRPALILPALGVLACTTQERPAADTASRPAMEHITMFDNWPYPFSSAVSVGNMLYLSGQMGTEIVDGAPKLVSGGIEAEARQTLENIKAILEKSGSSMDRVVKCMVMLADMSEWPKLNAVYASYFPGPKPARSAWGANGLALGGRVEITCIATTGPAS